VLQPVVAHKRTGLADQLADTFPGSFQAAPHLVRSSLFWRHSCWASAREPGNQASNHRTATWPPRANQRRAPRSKAASGFPFLSVPGPGQKNGPCFPPAPAREQMATARGRSRARVPRGSMRLYGRRRAHPPKKQTHPETMATGHGRQVHTVAARASRIPPDRAPTHQQTKPTRRPSVGMWAASRRASGKS
jgi:hypothetical protein